jgi:hypothetical protein
MGEGAGGASFWYDPRMMPKPSIAFAVVLLATLGLGAAPARAELAIDIFGGVSWTKSTDVAVDGIDNTNVSVKGVFSNVSLPFLGLGLDRFYFSLPVPAQTVDSTVNVTGKIFNYSFFPDFELRDKSGLHFKTDLDTHNVGGGISPRF